MLSGKRLIFVISSRLWYKKCFLTISLSLYLYLIWFRLGQWYNMCFICKENASQTWQLYFCFTWFVMGQQYNMCLFSLKNALQIKHFHSSFFQRRCTLPWMPAQPKKIEVSFNFLNLLYRSGKTVWSIKLCLQWKGLFHKCWWLSPPCPYHTKVEMCSRWMQTLCSFILMYFPTTCHEVIWTCYTFLQALKVISKINIMTCINIDDKLKSEE